MKNVILITPDNSKVMVGSLIDLDTILIFVNR